MAPGRAGSKDFRFCGIFPPQIFVNVKNYITDFTFHIAFYIALPLYITENVCQQLFSGTSMTQGLRFVDFLPKSLSKS